MDVHRLDPDEVEHNKAYFERVYALSEIAGLETDQILDDPVVADRADHPDQVAYDVGRINRSVEEETLPDEQLEAFQEIEGTAAQLDQTDYGRVGADGPSGLGVQNVTDTVEEYVAESLETDRELGYDTDVTSALFYAKHREQRLRADGKIDGLVDQTYVIDVLDSVDIDG